MMCDLGVDEKGDVAGREYLTKFPVIGIVGDNCRNAITIRNFQKIMNQWNVDGRGKLLREFVGEKSGEKSKKTEEPLEEPLPPPHEKFQKSNLYYDYNQSFFNLNGRLFHTLRGVFFYLPGHFCCNQKSFKKFFASTTMTGEKLHGPDDGDSNQNASLYVVRTGISSTASAASAGGVTAGNTMNRKNSDAALSLMNEVTGGSTRTKIMFRHIEWNTGDLCEVGEVEKVVRKIVREHSNRVNTKLNKEHAV